VGGNINSPTDNTFCEKFQILKAIENEIFVVKHTVIQLICMKTWRRQEKMMEEQNLDFFVIRMS